MERATGNKEAALTSLNRSLQIEPNYVAALKERAELRLAAAVKLFELGRLSSGAAGRLAGVPRTVFLTRLVDYGVDTFRQTETELLRETRLA